MTKICNKCKSDKDELDFSPAQFYKNSGWCKLCISLGKKSYYRNNKEIIHFRVKNYQQGEKSIKYRKEYYIENKDSKLAYNKSYYEENKENIISSSKQYNIVNKEKIAFYKKEYQKARRIIDPQFKLRSLLSNAIGSNIKKNGSIKNYKSVLKFLPYSIQELKVHLESLFEHWMTWQNHGDYNSKTWNDNDSTTWTWQVDHIIPHSKFNYSSMEDQEFKDCWALTNLRPYSAKQNLLDGNKR